MDKHDNKKSVQSQFGQNARQYVTSKWHKTGKDLAKLIEIADTRGDERALDIATGGGHVANALASKVKSVVAYDLTNEILNVARSFVKTNGNHNVEFVQGDAEKLPFQDGEFDLVTCRIAAHHFQNPTNFVSESYRTLKKGGSLLLIDNVAPEKDDFDIFYNKVEKERDYSHSRAWKKSEWIKILENAGFEIEEMHRFMKTFHFDEWCDRLSLPEDKKQQLSIFMLNAPQEYRTKFRINIIEGKVYSFMGESTLLKAVR